MLKRIFFPFGETSRTPKMFRRSWWSMLVRVTGVCPRRDHVRLSGDTIVKPASSSRPSVAFKSRVFFYLWQYFFLPFRNRFFVPLKSATLWALVAPAHSIHHIPNCTWMITHLEQLPNDLGDPVECPIVASIPKGKSA